MHSIVYKYQRYLLLWISFFFAFLLSLFHLSLFIYLCVYVLLHNVSLICREGIIDGLGFYLYILSIAALLSAKTSLLSSSSTSIISLSNLALLALSSISLTSASCLRACKASPGPVWARPAFVELMGQKCIANALWGYCLPLPQKWLTSCRSRWPWTRYRRGHRRWANIEPTPSP